MAARRKAFDERPGLRGAARVEALVVQGSAKGQGRNRAIGITAARADEDAALRQIEADFDQAWQDGRITLQRTAGPAAPDAELAPAPAEEATESRKAPALVA